MVRARPPDQRTPRRLARVPACSELVPRIGDPWDRLPR